MVRNWRVMSMVCVAGAGMLGGCAGMGAGNRMELDAKNVKVVGEHARAADSTELRYVGYWTDVDTTLEWTVKDLRAGTYRVTMIYGLDPKYAPGRVELTAAGQKAGRLLVAGRNWDDMRLMDMGTMKLPGGEVKVVLKATEKPGEYVMNFDKVVMERLAE